MTLKTLFRNLYRTEAKRNIWLTCISIFALFLCLPFALFQKLVTYQSTHGVSFKSAYLPYDYAKSSVLNGFLYENDLLFLALIGLAVLNGIFLFSYLFSKQKLDFYFSQPVKRSTFFWCSYVQGILNVAVPYFFFNIIVAGMLAYNHCSMGIITGILLQNYLVNMLLYLTIYTLAVFSSVLTGTLLFAFLGTVVLGIYFPAYYFIFQMATNSYSTSFSKIVNKLFWLSPISIFMELRSNIQQAIYHSYSAAFEFRHYSVGLLFSLGIWFLVLLTTGFILFQKRSAEAAGKTLAFSKSKGIIKGALAVYFSVFMAYFMPSMFFSGDLGYQIVGLFLGSAFALYVLDAMIELNWRAFFQNWRKQFKYIAVSAVFFVALQIACEMIQYHGFDNIPANYSKEQALADGCVWFEFDKMTDGEESWNEFVQNTKNGEDDKIRLAFRGYGDGTYLDVVYKEGKYTIYHDYNLYDKSDSYDYLLVLTGIDPATSEHHRFAIITDDKEMTFEEMNEFYFGESSLDLDEMSSYRSVFIE